MSIRFQTVFRATSLSAIAALCSFGQLASMPQLAADDKPPAETANSQSNLAKALSQAFREASAKMLPSVVTIRTRVANSRQGVESVVGSDEHDNFMTVGSGVIISQDGLVITNNHVVARAREIQVELSDGRRLATKDVRGDEKSDVAVLRAVSNKKLAAAQIANSDEIMVGDWVLAIGSPFDLHASVSAGIISSKVRGLRDLGGQFLQTDAAVNPGNSGGPLVNLDGQVVGISTAIASQNGVFNGVGYAIPINRAFWISNELIEHNKVRRAVMRIRTQPIPYSVLDDEQLSDVQGAYVSRVTRGGPADKAGVKNGDIILEFADQRVTTSFALQEIVEQCPIGKSLDLIVLRDAKRVELQVVLETDE